MDKNHDNEHVKSNSSYQYSFFEEIIKKQNPLSNISVYKPRYLREDFAFL